MPRAADPTPDQPITRTVLLDARLRQVKATGRVEIREIRILPGHAAGLHVHNGPVVGSIVDGSAVYQVEGERETVLRPGDVFLRARGRADRAVRPAGRRRDVPGLLPAPPGSGARAQLPRRLVRP